MFCTSQPLRTKHTKQQTGRLTYFCNFLYCISAHKRYMLSSKAEQSLLLLKCFQRESRIVVTSVASSQATFQSKCQDVHLTFFRTLDLTQHLINISQWFAYKDLEIFSNCKDRQVISILYLKLEHSRARKLCGKLYAAVCCISLCIVLPCVYTEQTFQGEESSSGILDSYFPETAEQQAIALCFVLILLEH